MYETQDALVALQALLDKSFATAGSHLAGMLEAPMTARDVVAHLEGICEVHFATVTPSGAPFVAPIDGLFFRGQLWIGIPTAAARTAFVSRERRISVSYTRGRSFCLIVHGTAEEVTESDPMWAPYHEYSDREYVKLYGAGFLEWAEQQKAEGADGDMWRVRAHKMFVKE